MASAVNQAQTPKEEGSESEQSSSGSVLEQQPQPVPEPAQKPLQEIPGILNIPVPVNNAKVAPAINYFLQLGHGTPETAFRQQQAIGRDSATESSTSSESALGVLDTEDAAKLYSFVPRSLRQAPEDIAASRAARFQLETQEPAPVVDRPPPGAVLVTVYDSKINGSDASSDAYTVELRTHGAVVGSNKEPQFQWIHMQPHKMVFDDFRDNICGHPSLVESEKKDLNHILSKMKKDCQRRRQRFNDQTVSHLKKSIIFRRLLVNDGANQNRSGKLMVWGCVPYICLQKYVGDSAEPLSSFPPETLMQAGSAGSTKSRDLKQAVCRMTTGPNKLCFHVAQLWVVVINDTLLFTCGMMSQQDLLGKTIKITSSPPKSVPQETASLFVSYNGCWLWRIPLEECVTWFDFVSFFREFWPKKLEFSFRGEEVTSEDWEDRHKLAQESRKNIIIEFTTMSPPEPIEHGILKSLSSDSLQPRATKIHLFSCGEPGTNRMLDDLKDADIYLSSDTKYTDHMAYAQCRPSTREAVHAMLLEQGSNIVSDAAKEGKPAKDKKNGGEHEARIDLFNVSQMLLGFFVPLETESPTTAKFWGAVHTILEVRKSC